MFLAKGANLATNAKDHLSLRCADFWSKLRNLFISRCGSDPDHCLRYVQAVLHPKIKIRSSSVVDIAELDRFISRDVGRGLVGYFFGRIFGQLCADWEPLTVEHYLKKRISQCKSSVDGCSTRSAGCGEPLVA